MKRIDQRIKALQEFLDEPAAIGADPGPYEAASDELEELRLMRARGEDLPAPSAPVPSLTVHTIQLVLDEMYAQGDNHKFGRCLHILWDTDPTAVALYHKLLRDSEEDEQSKLAYHIWDWLGSDLHRVQEDIAREGIPRAYAHGLRSVALSKEGKLHDVALDMAFRAETGMEA